VTVPPPLKSFILQLMRAVWKLIALALALNASLASGTGQRTILVSAAISLKSAFEEIGSLYEKQTGVRVEFNLGASGLLQKQIEEGAPVDVFASAGEKQMDELQARNLIIPETRRNLVQNTLLLIIPADSQLTVTSFSDLLKPGLERVAIGNPKTVPAGQYAEETLRYFKLWDKIQPRLVLAENVRQVLDYVVRGEVQAGIVYSSDVLTARGEVKLAATAPKESHKPILYPIAVVRGTPSRADAQRYIDLSLSRTGQDVLAKYGFVTQR
jgi:molybdate transport system substrate-binding protein